MYTYRFDIYTVDQLDRQIFLYRLFNLFVYHLYMRIVACIPSIYISKSLSIYSYVYFYFVTLCLPQCAINVCTGGWLHTGSDIYLCKCTHWLLEFIQRSMHSFHRKFSSTTRIVIWNGRTGVEVVVPPFSGRSFVRFELFFNVIRFIYCSSK